MPGGFSYHQHGYVVMDVNGDEVADSETTSWPEAVRIADHTRKTTGEAFIRPVLLELSRHEARKAAARELHNLADNEEQWPASWFWDEHDLLSH